jgi:hypothetical protein
MGLSMGYGRGGMAFCCGAGGKHQHAGVGQSEIEKPRASTRPGPSPRRQVCATATRRMMPL